MLGSDQEKIEAATRVGATTGFWPDFDRRVYCLLGMVVDAVAPAQVVDHIGASIRHGKRCFLVTSNMSFVTASRSDPEFHESLLRCDLRISLMVSNDFTRW